MTSDLEPAELFHQALKANGIRHMVTVANGQTYNVLSRFAADEECKLVYACREGEAVGIASGLVLGGLPTAVSMECTGLFESCDTIRGLPVTMDIPMLFLIGYFGERTPGWEQKYAGLGGMLKTVEHASQWLEPFLQAMKIPYYAVAGADDIGKVDQAARDARERSGPAAILIEMLGN
jgi:sulfopyruvate decarboxylase TPP-binding subunit